MRKLCFLLLLIFMVGASPAQASAAMQNARSKTEVSTKTPVGLIVKGFFRKIFTGKDQMSEKKIKKALRRQK